MNFSDFQDTLTKNQMPSGLSIFLKALWLDGKGKWHEAHDLVDGHPGELAAWIHAYLHRKEGDNWNANYWYRRAGKNMPEQSLNEEWESLVHWFLESEGNG